MKLALLLLLATCIAAQTLASGQGDEGAHKLPTPERRLNLAGGMSAENAHALCMGVAWAIVVPFGMFIARFGRGIKTWFYFHAFAQISALVLVVVGFIMAVQIDDDQGAHFADKHNQLGLFIVLAMLVQVLLALARPHHGAANDEGSSLEADAVETGSVASDSSAGPNKNSSSHHHHKITLLRRLWANQHRIFAVVLIVTAYINLHLGLEAAEWNSKWNKALIGVAAGTAGLWVILEVLQLAIPRAFGREKPVHKRREQEMSVAGTSVSTTPTRR